MARRMGDFVLVKAVIGGTYEHTLRANQHATGDGLAGSIPPSGNRLQRRMMPCTAMSRGSWPDGLKQTTMPSGRVRRYSYDGVGRASHLSGSPGTDTPVGATMRTETTGWNATATGDDVGGAAVVSQTLLLHGAGRCHALRTTGLFWSRIRQHWRVRL